ncbi:NAD(P)-dependent oxidoreductase [Denitrobaculum tricleocarpae]|uniref:NAD(P)-dependent oxidoreductase n=1 Tax=Denitrobaculum tricleocarpae TaxID=2591009 RepID=A0A545U210_9PROT|nr:NAD(P)-dependent oxidoreductase [Denitrobaculum tricleocarpae]TQV83474.1 NAD(P)-dependent oxidoreductase [Denitrobaculum tricleocarpae]
MIISAGFIGIGAMGLPMTTMLAKNGVPMTVWDANPEQSAKAGQLDGVRLAENIAELVGAAEVIFTCLPNDQVVESVYLGDGGIVGALTPGRITVDCSTVSSKITQRVADAAKKQDSQHMDASMLGSIPQAESGEIGFVVGGDPAALQKIQPLLDILGRFTKHAGPAGSANRIKMIHQTLVAANAVAVAEAIALCEASDTDLDCFYDVVCNAGGFAYSRYFEKRVPRMRDGDFSPLFMLDLMTKDSKLARDLARDVGMSAPLLDQVIARFQEGQANGLGAKDFSAVARLYQSGGKA